MPVLIYIWLILSYVRKAHSLVEFKCIGEDLCYGQTIACNSWEGDCYVECSGKQACRDTTILCPIGYACNVKCYTSQETDVITNELTCYGMIIRAVDSTILTFIADFGETGQTLPNPRTFENGQIYCPNNYNLRNDNTNTKSCQIYCNGDDLMRKPVIYAVEGFNDISIISTFYLKSWCIRGAIMACTEDFSSYCPITNISPFQCRDEDITCMEHIITPTHTINTKLKMAIGVVTLVFALIMAIFGILWFTTGKQYMYNDAYGGNQKPKNSNVYESVDTDLDVMTGNEQETSIEEKIALNSTTFKSK